jgi:hypothetical protein
MYVPPAEGLRILFMEYPYALPDKMKVKEKLIIFNRSLILFLFFVHYCFSDRRKENIKNFVIRRKKYEDVDK